MNFFDKKNDIYKKTREHMNEVVRDISNNQEDLLNCNWETFINVVSITSPQRYGGLIEKRLVKELKLIKKKSSEDSGDFTDAFGDHYEFKSSIIKKDGDKINLVQIRPWQNTNYYIVAIRFWQGLTYCFAFKLSHEQMMKELVECKATAAHGTKKAILNNENVEYRFSIKPLKKDENFRRWIQNYRSNFFDNKVGVISESSVDNLPF